MLQHDQANPAIYRTGIGCSNMKTEMQSYGSNEDLFFALGVVTQEAEAILVELNRRGLVPSGGFFIDARGPARPTKWTQYFKPIV